MRYLALSVLVVVCLVTPSDAQDKPKGGGEFNAFVDKPREGWEWDKDERLDDLILQLQEKELALQAIDVRTAKLLGRKAGTKMAETMAWRAMDRMDLNAGGPIRWDAFYGRNAENFFYHPVDPNTTYHTNTVLQQVQPTSAGGVPGNQGVPAHQRPPQFDYMYRGYERRQDKAKADASEIANKVEILKDRRRQLEQEVVLLWTKIAFRVLDRDKVAEKPVLRWVSLPVTGGNEQESDRSLAFNEATRLLAIALLFNEQRVESEGDKVFRTVSTAIQANRKNFEDSLLRAGDLLDDSEDKTKPIGQYKFLSRKLEDTAKTLSEGYRGWQDGEANDDEPTKFVGLRRVQDSVVMYAKILLAMNELVDVMKKDWGLKLNPDSTEFVPDWEVAYTPRQDPGFTPGITPQPFRPKPQPADSRITAIESGLDWLLRHQMPDGSWSFDHARCPACGGKCGNSATGNQAAEPSASTGLALLAFAGHGQTHMKGDHKQQLKKAVQLLARKSLDGDGKCYGHPGGTLYNQGVAGWALAACYGETKDRELRKPAQMALDFIQKAQDPRGGGWRYTPQQPGDTSATGWHVSALLAGKRAGLTVRNDVLTKVHGFLDSVAADGGSSYGYTEPGQKPGTSAVGLFCRTKIEGFGWTTKQPAIARGMNYLLTRMPSEDLYFDFYATRALQQAATNQRRQWNDAMLQLLLAHQSREGHEAGSWWNGVNKGHSAEVGGRLLCTAFAVLILEACDIQ
jgi:hypothetical protein